MSQNTRTERLINLLFLLMSARHAVSRDTLRDALADYRDSPSDEAFERMFERDKEELRSMGVPIESVAGIGKGGTDGYRVSGEDYQLPAITLDAEAMRLLALAASIWEQATLGPAAHTAMLKLQALGAEADLAGPALVTRIRDPEPAFATLLAAIQTRRVAAFDYRKPSDLVGVRRHLEPWGLAARRGQWYVVGRDKDRAAPRVFRLSRIMGAVAVTGPESAFDVPDHDIGALVDTDPHESTSVATLRVRPGAALSLRRAGRQLVEGHDWDTIEVDYRDPVRFARDLAGHGAAVVVDEPAELRRTVLSSLRATTALGESR